jgi:hypothetical protein
MQSDVRLSSNGLVPSHLPLWMAMFTRQVGSIWSGVFWGGVLCAFGFNRGKDGDYSCLPQRSIAALIFSPKN